MSSNTAALLPLLLTAAMLRHCVTHGFQMPARRMALSSSRLLPLQPLSSRRPTLLTAVSSRELRFHNGSSSNGYDQDNNQNSNDKDVLYPITILDELPEMASVANQLWSTLDTSPWSGFFFATNRNGATTATSSSSSSTTTQTIAKDLVRTTTTTTNTMTATSTTATSSATRVSSSSTTTTTSLLQAAPPSMLQVKQVFRASSSTANGSGSNNDNNNGSRKTDNAASTNNKKQARAPPATPVTPKQPVEHPEHSTIVPPQNSAKKEETPLIEKLQQQEEESKSLQQRKHPPPKQGYGYSIQLTDEEKRLFQLLRQVHQETQMTATLRVAGGWVRDKLLATPEFQIFHHFEGAQRLTSKFKAGGQPSMGRQGTKVLGQQKKKKKWWPSFRNKGNSNKNGDDLLHACGGPVDIDIALDTMLGREFADHLNAYLLNHGQDKVSVGVVLKNPEKSKHLETATMQVGSFWIDLVNLRAEEYTQDSRIPDLMRIGTASEDAFRRDLTINSLFFNINTGQVEDWTGRGFADLRRGVVATPLTPLTTLLDDPLRVLRSIRFAARLRFTMDDELVAAARDARVRTALAQKVSRERVGGEVDLMLRSPDPVGAMRLLINLKLADTVFPLKATLPSLGSRMEVHAEDVVNGEESDNDEEELEIHPFRQDPDPYYDAAQALQANQYYELFSRSLDLLSTTHDHFFDCKVSPPVWCQSKSSYTTHNVAERPLMEDEEARRLLWYAAFLKPIRDHGRRLKQRQNMQDGSSKVRNKGKKENRSLSHRLLVDELKRPARDAEAVEKIMQAADEFTQLIQSGCDLSATLILLSDLRVVAAKKFAADEDEMSECDGSALKCSMAGRIVDSATEEDPVWEHAMEFRTLCASVLRRVGSLWRAALILSLSEQLASLHAEGDLDYAIEGDVIDESQEERRQGIIEQYDTFAAALQQIGLIGIWGAKPLLDGGAVKKLLPSIPMGPVFRQVMDTQEHWITTHPGASKAPLVEFLSEEFADYAKPPEKKKSKTIKAQKKSTKGEDDQ